MTIQGKCDRCGKQADLESLAPISREMVCASCRAGRILGRQLEELYPWGYQSENEEP